MALSQDEIKAVASALKDDEEKPYFGKWVNSQKIWKRALGYWGYTCLGSLMVFVPVYAISFLMGLLIIGALLR